MAAGVAGHRAQFQEVAVNPEDSRWAQPRGRNLEALSADAGRTTTTTGLKDPTGTILAHAPHPRGP